MACMKILGCCCGRTLDACIQAGAGGDRDALLWSEDIGRHVAGEFSMAVVQANSLLEDASQIESGSHGTFVGVYDGHGGPEASLYVRHNMYQNLRRHIVEEGISVDALHKAFSATEDGFLAIVKKNWSIMPQLATVGSCCLIGFVHDGLLYVANLGDSRAVLGRFNMRDSEVSAVQLTSEHNVCHESVREELHLLHPDDHKIVVLNNMVWRVKGIIQVSRSIGDAYLKKAEFNREPLISKFRLSESFANPILIAEPSIVTHKICPEDQFVIFASDGLWEHISNQEAVDMVQNYPHTGIARRIIKAALQVAAMKRGMRYSDLKSINRGIRRHFHDDITVIVLFLDHSLVSRSSYAGPVLSLTGGKEPGF